MSNENQFRILQGLLAQIKGKKIRVLSSSSAGASRSSDLLALFQSREKSKSTENFIMNVMDAQFQSALANHRMLLQQLMDTAMACQQYAYECARSGKHSQNCLGCDLASATSTNCFMLSKHLFSRSAIAPQVLLQCVDACQKFKLFLLENEKYAEHLIDDCQRLTDACMLLYKKVGLN